METVVNRDSKLSELMQIQKVQLATLEELVDFFSKEKLKYFISGGTVLGSNYFKNFIPYDDDIDIAMSRSDFNKFLQLVRNAKFSSQNLKVAHYTINPNFKYTSIRIQNVNLEVVDVSNLSGEVTFPSIDIASIDGSPNNKLKRWIYYKKLLFLRGKLTLAYFDTINLTKKRTTIQKFEIKMFKIIGQFLTLNPVKIKQQIDQTLSHYPMENSTFSGTYMGAYKEKEFIKTSTWGNPKAYEFNNKYYMGPENTDAYISELYGGFTYYEQDEQNNDRHYFLPQEGNIQ
ncbi:LicD family protein [Leuconostoc gasicomitatum]|uniref:LicD family protein n=1 Tax=Leuconostoc gasicomitatum TaxID=115778 RepID=UPI000744AEC2|nr:LicD family protein [Leuconostoc gasicomitatum]CUR63285.1 LicD family phosphotransferase EpsG [Leuconostoc gasicomitatum KG16-1]